METETNDSSFSQDMFADTDEEEESLETPFRSNNRASGRPRINNSKTKSKSNRSTAKNTRQRYQIEEKNTGIK